MSSFLEVYQGGHVDEESGRAFTGRIIVKDPYPCEVCKRPRVCLVVTVRDDSVKGYVPPVGICRPCAVQAFGIFAETP